MFGRYGRAGGIGEIYAGATFPNFYAPALRAIAATGFTGHNREGAPEVEVVVFSSGRRRAWFLCHKCGGIDTVEACEGLQKNTCVGVDAAPNVFVTIIRESDAQARRLGIFEW